MSVFFPILLERNKKNIQTFLSGTSLSSRRRVTAPARRAEKYVDLSEHAELHRLISLFHQHGPLQNVWLGSDGSELLSVTLFLFSDHKQGNCLILDGIY